ncbi:MAG: hypothetical protein KME04_05370 [Pleurocapsa minor GSE-CHR-MK-17-07R]|jgi:hypothetical protein|nr:hypothetical protein [Pleurocapsa minor GSE-CHR-MK 17-07R]
MTKIEWKFPEFRPGNMAQDPVQREFFTSNNIGGLEQALVRESIQNALDARAGSKPVGVRFGLIELPPEKYRRYLDGLLPHLQKIDGNLIEVPDLSMPMKFLIVEDVNTSGLTGDPEREYIDEPEADQNFYYFWRSVGRTGKKESNRGRWGLGKTVFPAMSTFSVFFGFTRQAKTNRYLLMGQAMLKHHTIGNKTFVPYGYFGQFRDEFCLPIDAHPDLEHFFMTFRLQRKDNTGLSIVIPSPIDVNEAHLYEAAIQQYFFPIVRRGLILLIGDNIRLSAKNIAETIESRGEEVLSAMAPEDRLALLRLVRLTQWAVDLQDDAFVTLNDPKMDGAPRWPDYVTEEQIEGAKARFEQEGRVAIKAAMKVFDKTRRSDKRVGWFKIFIERDDSLKKPESHFIRNGIRILEIKGHNVSGIRAMLVVDDEVLSEMLGNAENPAHTDWQRDAANFAKYEHGPSSLTFVKTSLSFWVGKLSESRRAVERDLLRDIFFVNKPNRGGKSKSEKEAPSAKQQKGDGQAEFPDIPKHQPAVQLWPINGGVVIAGSGAEEMPEFVRLQVAYDVRLGNPLAKYSALDFDLSDPETFDIRCAGAEIKSRDKNILEILVRQPDFRVQVTGFDERRDVITNLQYQEPVE